MFVLVRVMRDTNKMFFVAKTPSPTERSYTDRLQFAEVFDSMEEAERDRCTKNEYIVVVSDLFRTFTPTKDQNIFPRRTVYPKETLHNAELRKES